MFNESDTTAQSTKLVAMLNLTRSVQGQVTKESCFFLAL
jgi:hypothetical protein